MVKPNTKVKKRVEHVYQPQLSTNPHQANTKQILTHWISQALITCTSTGKTTHILGRLKPTWVLIQSLKKNQLRTYKNEKLKQVSQKSDHTHKTYTYPNCKNVWNQLNLINKVKIEMKANNSANARVSIKLGKIGLGINSNQTNAEFSIGGKIFPTNNPIE